MFFRVNILAEADCGTLRSTWVGYRLALIQQSCRLYSSDSYPRCGFAKVILGKLVSVRRDLWRLTCVVAISWYRKFNYVCFILLDAWTFWWALPAPWWSLGWRYTSADLHSHFRSVWCKWYFSPIPQGDIVQCDCPNRYLIFYHSFSGGVTPTSLNQLRTTWIIARKYKLFLCVNWRQRHVIARHSSRSWRQCWGRLGCISIRIVPSRIIDTSINRLSNTSKLSLISKKYGPNSRTAGRRLLSYWQVIQWFQTTTLPSRCLLLP